MNLSRQGRVELDDSLIIGRGLGRVVFRHPADETLCLKVPLRPGGAEDENPADAAELSAAPARALEVAGFPRFHGFVETSRGVALLTDLVRDGDGAVSRDAETWLREHPVSAEFVEAVHRLGARLAASGLMTRTLAPKNIAVRRLEGGRLELVVVDGFGRREIRGRIPWLARATTRRRFRRLLRGFRAMPGWAEAEAEVRGEAPGGIAGGTR